MTPKSGVYHEKRVSNDFFGCSQSSHMYSFYQLYFNYQIKSKKICNYEYFFRKVEFKKEIVDHQNDGHEHSGRFHLLLKTIDRVHATVHHQSAYDKIVSAQKMFQPKNINKQIKKIHRC